MEIRQSARTKTGFFYGLAVRRGTRPHFPPVAELMPWVVKVLGITGEREVRTVAFLIARAISRRGTRANEYDKRAMVQIRPLVDGIVKEEGIKLVITLRHL